MALSACLLAAHGRPGPYCGNAMQVPPRGKRKRTQHPRFPTRDHVIPKSVMPGQGTVVVCTSCNRDKANKTLTVWLHALDAKSDPRATTVREFIAKNPSARIEPPAAVLRAKEQADGH